MNYYMLDKPVKEISLSISRYYHKHPSIMVLFESSLMRILREIYIFFLFFGTLDDDTGKSR